ncbi:hypothetical protein [Dictyobacter arantiisoli]|uniref:Uncharacterized protein n=1 Tax=Dictyobacter arantiisoli TaxID=2014874 RepID=A0A5A5T7A1_9CHLR|nr:hypothetical protein [Dictyobacter arantiisoli]GCF06873.1 hypothetical protein KDI_04370 [Dictyobacter arantiisoli]
MSTHPRIESRVSAQERQQTILNARIEELSEDMAESFKQLTGDMAASFKQLVDYQVQTEHQMGANFDQIEKDVADIKATMTTKDDVAAMEGRIMDAFKQLLATINPQQPPAE